MSQSVGKESPARREDLTSYSPPAPSLQPALEPPSTTDFMSMQSGVGNSALASSASNASFALSSNGSQYQSAYGNAAVAREAASPSVSPSPEPLVYETPVTPAVASSPAPAATAKPPEIASVYATPEAQLFSAAAPATVVSVEPEEKPQEEVEGQTTSAHEAQGASAVRPAPEESKQAIDATAAIAPKLEAKKAGATPAAEAGPASEGKPATTSKTGAAAQAPATGAVEKPKAAPKTPAEGGGSAEPAEAPNPAEAIAPAISAVRHRAAGSRKHSPAPASVGSAQAAAINPETEQRRTAATRTVENLDAAKPEEVKRGEFKAQLKKALEAATPEPKTEAEADGVMKTGAAKTSTALRGQLATQRDAAAGPLKSAASSQEEPSKQPAPPTSDLKLEQVGPAPAPVSAAPVVPAPLPAERLDYSSDRGPTDQLMAENEVTTEQLEEGNEPAFGPVIEARSTAEEHEAGAEAGYRQSESKVQDQAQGQAGQALAQGLKGIHGTRASQIGQVAGEQTGTKNKSAEERQRITDQINAIKDKTRIDVDAILTAMETDAATIFEEGLKRAEAAYEEAFEEAKGGFLTRISTWDWEGHIEQSLATARRVYLAEVETAIDQVADSVEAKLAKAKQRVAAGRKEVSDFVKGLDDSVKKYGKEALDAVSADFDAMSSDIDQHRDALIDKLATQYKDSYGRMNEMEQKLRDENKSLWQRVYDAAVGIINAIINLKDMLVNTLSRVADAVSMIIAHPIDFLGNLVDGVKLGFDNFTSKIEHYLEQALVEWIFGELGDAGIQMPETFDLKGILSLVMQVLGLTYANIRARAVGILGEKVVAALETTAEIFKILITEGPAGLWEYIKDEVGDLKSMVIEQIKSFVEEKIIKAGIMWLIGMLNPVSAFIKACKGIYDIIMFFVDHAAQIMALVNAIIDSVTEIAKGNIAGAAAFVEKALAKGLTVVIGFLAALLGLGGIGEKIKSIIEMIRKPINKAIDWVINQAVKLVKAAGKLLGFGKEEDDKKEVVRSPEAQAGLEALNTLNEKYKDGVEEDELKSAVANVRSEHPAFKKLEVDHNDEGFFYEYQLSPEETVPGPRSKKVKIKLSRPSGFRVATKESLRARFPEQHKKSVKSRALVKVSEARRHIIPSQEMLAHYETSLNGLDPENAKILLEAKCIPKDIEVEGLSNENIEAAAQALLREFFNDIENLWVGNSVENSTLKDVWDFPSDWTPEKIDDHLKTIAEKYRLK